MQSEGQGGASLKQNIVLIVPPFAPTFQPSLACHLLQACAGQRGHDVTVVYANLVFASIVGHAQYRRMLERRVVAEKTFKSLAFDAPDAPDLTDDAEPTPRSEARAARDWLDRVMAIVGPLAPAVVGATCSFEQISSSVALLTRCKFLDPTVTTVIGGANCEGDMAEGMLSLRAGIDHVVSGESEQAFPDLLDQILEQGTVPQRIIRGRPCMDLDSLPLPDYHEYFQQYERHLGADRTPGASPQAVPYESSRGCWWGQKHHCTFCGLNGSTLTHREKSADRVVDDLVTLLKTYPVDTVNMVDNIMPHRYFTTLLPKLASLPPSTSLFYEQKANLSFEKVKALKAARVTTIQPGIESLNSHILQCMDKGTTAHQNIALLRYARSLGVAVTWNLLAGFPGDRVEDYEEMAEIIPHLVHLQPPDGLGMVRLDRFSPYHQSPERYGIRNVRPKALYYDLFPPWTEHDKLAYYFDGDYDCGAFECPELLDEIAQMVVAWRSRWERSPKPLLSVVSIVGDHYVLIDSRDESSPPRIDAIDDRQAALLLRGADVESRSKCEWAVERHLLLELDGRLRPVATAHSTIMSRFLTRQDARSSLPIHSVTASGRSSGHQMSGQQEG